LVECRIQIVNRLGLHARAAARLVRAASAFRSAMRLERADRSSSADAKSILSVLMLAASRGTELIITADGEDEQDALDSLCRLISGGFGEGEE
jgi:phosphocarrier protein HPr